MTAETIITKTDKSKEIDWSDSTEGVGTPTLALLPARNYRFKVCNKEFKISIPRKGAYFDIDPNFFSKEDGEFNILADKSSILYMPSISKVLFATGQYPDLNNNQLFTPVMVVFKRDVVEITGQVLEILNSK